jgi:hypothetical protein
MTSLQASACETRQGRHFLTLGVDEGVVGTLAERALSCRARQGSPSVG